MLIFPNSRITGRGRDPRPLLFAVQAIPVSRFSRPRSRYGRRTSHRNQ